MTAPQVQSDNDEELLARAARWPSHTTLEELTPDAALEFARSHGTDFATALLYDRVMRSPRHRAFIAELDSLPVPQNSKGVTIAIVPGAFYKEHSSTGSDGRQVAEAMRALGCRVETIPIASLGSLDENARLIREWLAAHRNIQPIVLISLSKGGADVKWGLAHDADHVFKNVVGWISISGILQGSSLTGWLFGGSFHSKWTQFLLQVQRYDLEVAQEMGRRKGSLLDFPLRFPQHLRVVQIVGFPLEHHLSGSFARKGYQRSKHLGPNDGGGIILADACHWAGELYPVWGSDHYLRPRYCDLNRIVTKALSFCLSSAEQPVNQ